MTKNTKTPMADDLFRWVEANVPLEARKGSGPSTLEQVCWYVAYQDAQILQEGATARHLAQAILAGIGPYKTLEHVEEWLQGRDVEEIRAGMLGFWGD